MSKNSISAVMGFAAMAAVFTASPVRADAESAADACKPINAPILVANDQGVRTPQPIKGASSFCRFTAKGIEGFMEPDGTADTSDAGTGDAGDGGAGGASGK